MQKFIDINFFHPLTILCHKCSQTSEVPVEEGFLTQVKASDSHTQPAHLPLTPLFKRTEDALLPSHLGTASTGVHSWPLCTWPELDRDPVAHAETTGFQKEQTYSSLLPFRFFHGEGNGSPLQFSWLENPMDREACWATVHGVAKSRTGLSNLTHSLTEAFPNNFVMYIFAKINF